MYIFALIYFVCEAAISVITFILVEIDYGSTGIEYFGYTMRIFLYCFLAARAYKANRLSVKRNLLREQNPVFCYPDAIVFQFIAEIFVSLGAIQAYEAIEGAVKGSTNWGVAISSVLFGSILYAVAFSSASMREARAVCKFDPVCLAYDPSVHEEKNTDVMPQDEDTVQLLEKWNDLDEDQRQAVLAMLCAIGK